MPVPLLRPILSPPTSSASRFLLLPFHSRLLNISFYRNILLTPTAASHIFCLRLCVHHHGPQPSSPYTIQSSVSCNESCFFHCSELQKCSGHGVAGDSGSRDHRQLVICPQECRPSQWKVGSLSDDNGRWVPCIITVEGGFLVW